jgi:hypothetical protein
METLQRLDLEALLSSAAGSGNLTALRELLDAGASLSWGDADGTTALHRATVAGHAEVVNFLLDAGADPERTDSGGLTALHFAAQLAHTDAAAQLLARKVPVDANSKKGATPLMRAVWNDAVACADLLLRSGANPSLSNTFGDTALQMAERTSRQHMLALFHGQRALCVARQRLAFVLHGNRADAAQSQLPYDVVVAVCEAVPLCSYTVAARAAKQLIWTPEGVPPEPRRHRITAA